MSPGQRCALSASRTGHATGDGTSAEPKHNHKVRAPVCGVSIHTSVRTGTDPVRTQSAVLSSHVGLVRRRPAPAPDRDRRFETFAFVARRFLKKD